MFLIFYPERIMGLFPHLKKDIKLKLPIGKKGFLLFHLKIEMVPGKYSY